MIIDNEKKVPLKIQRNIENIFTIIINLLNNPQGIDMPLNK